MTHIQLDYGKTLEFFGEHELQQQKDIVKSIHKTIHEGTGAGSDFLGWIDIPVDYVKEEFSRILEASKRVKENTDVVLFSKNKLLYPLGAIYSKNLIPFMEDLIIKGEYKPLKLIRNSNFIELPIENTNISDEVFRNINTPQDYDELIKYYDK